MMLVSHRGTSFFAFGGSSCTRELLVWGAGTIYPIALYVYSVHHFLRQVYPLNVLDSSMIIAVATTISPIVASPPPPSV
jgi:hypothetical protein